MPASNRRIALSSLAIAAAASAATAQQKAVQVTNSAVNPSGYVRIADAADLHVQQFTLEAWITPSGDGYGHTTDPYGAGIISKPQENTVGTYIFSWALNWCPANSGKLYFGLRNQQGTGTLGFSTGTIPVGTSAHVAMTFDGAAVRIYINGQLDTTATAVGTGVFYDTNSVLLGADNYGSGFYRRFTGTLDEVRIWNRAREGSEIAASMNCRLSGAEAGLVAYYPFNGSSAADATGHGHNGTLQGANATFVNEVVPISSACSHGVAYCTAGTTSHGCVATISSSGSASASATSGFTISATNVEGQKQGLIFYGVNGPQATAWGTSSSFLCLKAPTQRTTIASSGGTASQCNGSLALDWSAFVAANPTTLGAPFAAGDTVWAQAWFRDPPSPKTTSLSDALAFVVAP